MPADLSDHIFIKILEYGTDHAEFTELEITKALGLKPVDLVRYINGDYQEHFMRGYKNNVDFYYIKPAAILDYLEYLELQEARDSAKSAKKWAITAIVFSGLFALASCGLTLWQMTNTATVKIAPDPLPVVIKAPAVLNPPPTPNPPSAKTPQTTKELPHAR